MNKIIGDFSTVVKLSKEEAKEICKLGKGEGCCAFLVMIPSGFKCCRMDYPGNSLIITRLKDGTMNAKGLGGWKNCAWEGEGLSHF